MLLVYPGYIVPVAVANFAFPDGKHYAIYKRTEDTALMAALLNT